MENDSKMILIIDDDEDVRGAVVQILEFEGYAVGEASNGLEGLEKLKERVPHLILLDLMMPQMDGREFCAAIRKLPEFSHIPIIIFSADTETRPLPKDMGHTAAMKKPIQLETLIETVRNHLP